MTMFVGEVVLITGAASGIGKACVQAFLEQGATVLGLDISEVVTTVAVENYLGLVCDIADETKVKAVFSILNKKLGCLDMMVLNASIFPKSRNIADMLLGEWQKVMRINLDANVILLREAYPFLKQSPKGGRVVVNASKNVPAPGPGAAAYSASKAALTQLSRVAALESR
jgi:NAD(P)-dependent dehydrogenase (short-subunit alcohol dehydrogenase family)